MKQILLLTTILLSTTSLFSQTYQFNKSSKKVKARKAIRDDSFSLDVNVGFINFFNDDLVDDLLNDNVNFATDIGVTKVFDNQFYVSSGLSFSILDNGLFDAWKNTLDYFSVNADVGYVFKYHHVIEPYVAVGGSYISTTLESVPPFSSLSTVNKTYSINLTTGAVFWVRKSNYGVVVQHMLKMVNDDVMVSHNRFVVGLKYKFKP